MQLVLICNYFLTFHSPRHSSAIRQKSFDGNKKGIPLEYFEYERVFVDEIHECLCTTKDELSEARKNSNDDTGFHKVCLGSVCLDLLQFIRYAHLTHPSLCRRKIVALVENSLVLRRRILLSVLLCLDKLFLA